MKRKTSDQTNNSFPASFRLLFSCSDTFPLCPFISSSSHLYLYPHLLQSLTPQGCDVECSDIDPLDT